MLINIQPSHNIKTIIYYNNNSHCYQRLHALSNIKLLWVTGKILQWFYCDQNTSCKNDIEQKNSTYRTSSNIEARPGQLAICFKAFTSLCTSCALQLSHNYTISNTGTFMHKVNTLHAVYITLNWYNEYFFLKNQSAMLLVRYNTKTCLLILNAQEYIVTYLKRNDKCMYIVWNGLFINSIIILYLNCTCGQTYISVKVITVTCTCTCVVF